MGHAGCTSGYAAGYYKAVSSQGMNTCLRLVVNPGCSTDVPGCSTDVPSLATPLMCHPWLLWCAIPGCSDNVPSLAAPLMCHPWLPCWCAIPGCS